jgi:phenylacetate-CoA ligase
VVVEVLREDGTPCQPGEVGRVVVTSLHNFAMPLIRYEILDYAELGAPCPCGRSLPVLKRILGRTRNLLTLPDGSRYMPKTTGATVQASQVAPVEQIQVIQHSVELVEIKLAVARPLHPAEEQQVIGIFQEALGHPFTIQLTRVDHIPRSAGGKFEDFISHVIPDTRRA